MRIIRHIHHVSDELRGGAVAVGNFDGLHRGHQALIRQCRAMADAVAGPALALTFE
ncbi:MAG: adenylyltransferase/cytidyltransferase family protein, partial [Rhodospirillaceae bacterium]|nr:adenylyltransferase/cytidyltransferase family protein [Rhodospirillaceae bacterium]